MRTFTGGDDPRRVGGKPAGTLVDTRNAVLAEHAVATVLEATSPTGDTSPTIGLLLAGRINLTNERMRLLFLLDGEGVAGLMTELLEVSLRAGGGGLARDVLDQLSERLGRDAHHHAPRV